MTASGCVRAEAKRRLAELPRAHEHGAQARGLGASDVGLDVVANHDRLVRRRSELGERGVEVRARRLADDLRLDPRRVLEPGDERARVEQRPARGLPPAVLVQADEAGAALELREGPIQVVVAEDPACLVALVGAPEQDDLCVLVDELDPRGEIVANGLHGQG